MRRLTYPVVAVLAALVTTSPLAARQACGGDLPACPGTTVAPEPATYALMAAGLAGIAVIARRRKNKNG